MKKSQVAIEFLLLVMTAFFITIVLLIVTYSMSESKNKENTFYELDDFGKSVQQEMLIASELENGYIRKINFPQTVNGYNYNVTMDQTSEYNSYFIIGFQTYLFSYIIPHVEGSFVKGDNYIIKNTTGIYITNS